nr:unnamed protein product [Callosobruchus analis]
MVNLGCLKKNVFLGTTSPTVPYFFVGGEAFGLHKNFLRPFAGHQLTVAKIVFNYRLSRARRYVECTFGTSSNKWRIFHRPLNLHPAFATKTVQACVVLHNFVMERDDYGINDALTITGLQDNTRNKCMRGAVGANTVRRIMMDINTSWHRKMAAFKDLTCP